MRRAAALLAGAALAAGGCGGDDDSKPLADDPGPVHVHGLGVNPKDGALFVATHTGLFRAARGESKATRVGDSRQDTMGFTVVGPDRFLGSGHPGAQDGSPPFLGLIASSDAGRSWSPVSLRGMADFHVLEAAGQLVYGFGSDWETRREQFLTSTDGGRTWRERRAPESLVSLALDPDDPRHLIASGQRSLHESRDGGGRWTRLSDGAGLVAWQPAGRIALVGPDGTVATSADGRRWSPVGQAGGEPASFEAARDGLYVALHDGTIKRSADGGRTWEVRSRP